MLTLAQQQYFSRKGWVRHLNAVRRKAYKRRMRSSLHRHHVTMKRQAEKMGKAFHYAKGTLERHTKPPFTGNIPYLSSIPNLFSTKNFSRENDGHLVVPIVFSFIDNYKESFDFLKRLFMILYRGRAKKVVLDYKKCERIDVDASLCMDIILAEFINYRNHCIKKQYRQFLPGGIATVNYEKPSLLKVLFSVGAFKTLRSLKIDFEDVEPLPVLINHLRGPGDIWARNELHLTNIVEYIKVCLKRLNRSLTTDAETEFYKVIGEVMSNAEEHSTGPYRYAIGFFQEVKENDDHFGIFNFSIFNFGDSIYDTFRSPNCKNPAVVRQMKELSADYTRRGFFSKAEFEEETLWCLYALQEGVTSREKKRGNGSIQYIENFFKLKGDSGIDNVSKLLVLSGSSRILFDGTYTIIEKGQPGRVKPFKMITFNKSGKIEDKPDKKYVTFAPHYFPGTLISARILIKDNNTME